MVKYFENVEEKFVDYLSDEAAIIKKGQADRIYFPSSSEEIQGIVIEASRLNVPVTISGGGTGLSGGRVPTEGWILATDDIRYISDENQETWTDPETSIEYGVLLKGISDQEAKLKVPVSMTIKAIQNYCREKGWFYPPDPTERSAFVGGSVNTNASGARSFKFGPTRDWILSLEVIMINGSILKLDRNENNGLINDSGIHIQTKNQLLTIPRPNYKLPKTKKNVAGPVITNDSHVIDLFIGTGGLFGITSEVTLKVIKQPREIVSIFAFCKTMDIAFKIIKRCQSNRRNNIFPIPMAVEYLGPRPIQIMHQIDGTIPVDNEALLIIEQDAASSESLEEAILYWTDLFDEVGIIDTRVAITNAEIETFKKLRHSVPETVNSIVKNYGQAKIGTDFAAPEEYLEEYFSLAFEIGRKFEQYQEDRGSLNGQPGYAVWAHAGDNHIHLNLIPRTDEESLKGKEMVIELISKTVELGGSIAAEHGLGKKEFGGKQALYYQYGQEGLNSIKNMKLAIDPYNLLNRGNLIK